MGGMLGRAHALKNNFLRFLLLFTYILDRVHLLLQSSGERPVSDN